jgi:hypothetical protein
MTDWRVDYKQPVVLDTQQSVDKVNELERVLKRPDTWKLGDKCYFIEVHHEPTGS